MYRDNVYHRYLNRYLQVVLSRYLRCTLPITYNKSKVNMFLKRFWEHVLKTATLRSYWPLLRVLLKIDVFTI